MKRRKSRFEDLDCWKAGREVRLFVARRIVPELPAEERYRLGDQIIRSARSVTANLAEGYGRFHYRDEAKFISNSRGSLQETLDHLITAHDEGIINDEKLQEAQELIDNALALINGYRAYIIRRSKEPTQPPIA